MVPVKIATPNKVNKLINILKYSNIIRCNNANELEVNSHAVPESNFDDLYAAILSPKGSQNIMGMTKIKCALRQLNIESKTSCRTKSIRRMKTLSLKYTLVVIINKRYHLRFKKHFKKTKSAPNNKR